MVPAPPARSPDLAPAPETDAPRVGVVVLRYGADDLTVRCLRALLADARSPSRQVVLVDNGPGPGFADRIRRELPEVVLVEPGRNLGFAAGCNAGVRALAADIDLVALVNNDVLVSDGWLAPLADALDGDPALGSASPKILLEGRFHPIVVQADRTWTPGRGDGRALGWRLRGVDGAAGERLGAVQLAAGFWEPDGEGTWAGPRASLLLPDGEGGGVVTIHAEAPPGGATTLHIEPPGIEATIAGGATTAVPIRLEGAPEPVVNNVGTDWRPDGYGVDLGFLELDHGQHDEPRDLPAWCGGAVLLHRRYLDQTGGFDERLFLYYEDLELSVRGARLGWRYRLVPSSVVQHRHAASFETDPLGISARRERNRLLVLLRHGDGARVASALGRFLLVTLSYVRRDVVARIARGERPTWASVRVRFAAMAGVARLGPGMLRSRWSDRRLPRPPWPDC